MKTKIIFLLCLLMQFFSLSLAEDKKTAMKQTTYESVSIINLIATPKKYHEEKIRVKGFVIIRFEHTHIYLSEEDAKHANVENAIFLDLGGDIEKYKKYDMQYISIEGIFEVSNIRGKYPRSLTKIYSLILWPKWIK